jgi:choice-of-anchor C domain-containing protein
MKLLICLVALAMPAAADIDINGLFNNGPSNPSYDTVFAGGLIGSAGLPQWTVINGGPVGNTDSNGSVDWIGTFWNPPVGVGGYTVDLDGNSPGGIEQAVATVIGQTYLLSFYLSGNPDGPPSTKSLQVNADSNQTTLSYTVPFGATEPNLTWTQESFQFTATNSSTNISFVSLDPLTENNAPPAFGPVLAGVSLAAVPEAGFYAYLLFALGTGALLVFVRRTLRA